MKDCGLQLEEYSWYLDLRRYGFGHALWVRSRFERLILFTYGHGKHQRRDSLPEVAEKIA